MNNVGTNIIERVNTGSINDNTEIYDICSTNGSAVSQENWVVALDSVAEARMTAWSIQNARTQTLSETRKGIA